MQDTLTPQGTDPHDAFEIAPGVVLAGRTEKPSPDLAPGATSVPASASSTPLSAPLSAPWTPHIATTHEATAPSTEPNFHITADDRVGGASGSKWASRIFMCLFAVVSAAAAAAWPHYSDAARDTIAKWIPPLAVISSQPPATTAAATPPVSPAVEASAQPAADAAPAQPAAPAQAAPDTAPTTTAAVAPPAAPTPQSMSRDIAAMGQQIEQLKASIEQLKAGQDKMADQMAAQLAQQAARKPLAARLPDPNARAKIAGLPVPPRPIRKPRPEFSPAQTAAILAAPRTGAAPAPLPPPQVASAPVAPAPYNAQAQVIDRPDGDPVERPPMPLR